MSAYRGEFDKTKYISFLIKHDELLEKYNEIWEKVKNSRKNEFDSKPVYNEKYLKAKIKSYNGKINTNFHNHKISKEGSRCICLSVILMNSVSRSGKSYYHQVFLEQCKYVVKDIKKPEDITDDTEIFSDSDREDSDEEISNEENSDEENSDENTHIIYLTHIIYITHKLILKAYKKTDKIFFPIYKNVNGILLKKQRKALRKGS